MKCVQKYSSSLGPIILTGTWQWLEVVAIGQNAAHVTQPLSQQVVSPKLVCAVQSALSATGPVDLVHVHSQRIWWQS